MIYTSSLSQEPAVSKWSFKLINQKLSPFCHVCIFWCYAKYVDHTISKWEVPWTFESVNYHYRTLEKRLFFINNLGIHVLCLIALCILQGKFKGKCNAASVAALFLEDMQTFPQSANGNRLFPDNRAPSWKILCCKSNNSLRLLLQDEAAFALGRE